MNTAVVAFCIATLGQASAPAPLAPSIPAAPASSLPAASAPFNFPAVSGPSVPLGAPVDPTEAAPSIAPEGSGLIAPYSVVPEVPAGPPVPYGEYLNTTRNLFQSDHAFDGFTGPLINPVQFKDPRSLTEARFLFMGDFSRGSTPVLGGGTLQVYALQLRLALTDRLQLFADKDGIVRLSPKGGKSVTGLANIAAGLKYVWIRNVEKQFLFTTAVQYEAPTGYSNIYQGQGSGLLGVYGIIGKQFGDNWHVLLQFGENIALQNQQTGYFLTDFHIDKRFGKFTPFYEVNWMYYNQPGNFLPLGIEGGGWLSLGSHNVSGLNYLTNAVGFKYDLAQGVELGVGYEFQLSNRTMLLNNMVHAQVIFRY